MSWEYKTTKLKTIQIISRKLRSIAEHNVVTTIIRNFEQTDVGFYSCVQKDYPKLIETILITSCK